MTEAEAPAAPERLDRPACARRIRHDGDSRNEQ